ncbi:unnamed protein product [Parajaminaea phylloscopi]
MSPASLKIPFGHRRLEEKLVMSDFRQVISSFLAMVGRFDGDPDELHRFKFKVRSALRREGPASRQLLLQVAVPMCLEGSALDWYILKTEQRSNWPVSWAQCEEELDLSFGHTIASCRPWDASKETLAQYFWSRVYLLKNGRTGRMIGGTGELFDCLVAGLPANMQSAVALALGEGKIRIPCCVSGIEIETEDDFLQMLKSLQDL